MPNPTQACICSGTQKAREEPTTTATLSNTEALSNRAKCPQSLPDNVCLTERTRRLDLVKKQFCILITAAEMHTQTSCVNHPHTPIMTVWTQFSRPRYFRPAAHGYRTMAAKFESQKLLNTMGTCREPASVLCRQLCWQNSRLCGNHTQPLDNNNVDNIGGLILLDGSAPSFDQKLS